MIDTEEREPLLSDSRISDFTCTASTGFYGSTELRLKHNLGGPGASFIEGASFARSYYEAKITSGELRVVKEVENIGRPFDLDFKCAGCDFELFDIFGNGHKFKYCPGCGNPIKR